ncbi:MAG: YceI family protein [Dietzia sp.]|nr:YceI family protein [Dietzia sp.]
MATTEWALDSSDGQLLVTTGVTGPAAKMGHRLTLTLTWQATVHWIDDAPSEVEVVADVGTLEVLRGDGGVKGLSSPEKVLARSNALKVFDADRYPQIRFHADDITGGDDGYRLAGTLEIHGTARPYTVDLHVEKLADTWRMSCEAPVSHSDFGLKPYSLMMGAMKVTDEVTVSFTAERAAG